MNLTEEQRLMRDRHSKKRPAVRRKVGVPATVSEGYLDQKDADTRYRVRLAKAQAERDRVAAELKHPSSKSLLIRLELKQRAIVAKGGRCVLCGYDRCPRALEFHHLDKQSKDFAISTFIGAALTTLFSQKGFATAVEVERIWESVEWELRKCELVCANCHREIEAGMVVLERHCGS